METTEKKEPYLQILNTRGNIYEEFLPDQVLTHKNLNKVVNYFEDQDRLSRIYLTGVGIGCGLNIVSPSSSKEYIEIGQGVGITTDGDIIKSETRRFQYYSALTDKADYAIFQQGDMKVYEIYEQEAAGRPGDELPLASFSTNESTTLKDCIIIAYVENYTEDEGLCGGSGCDETGNKVYSNLKFLITHKSNHSKLIADDTIYNSHDVLSYYDLLPELCLPRIILTTDSTQAGMSIIEKYKETFFLKDELTLGIITIIQQFSGRINFQRYNVFINQIENYINTIFGTNDDEYIQYKYDLLKDLIDTYREIRELILHSKFECVPNVRAFPKHLLLGTPEEATRLTTRHQFYPSPMVSENDKNLIAIKTLCIKFFNQLKEFKIPEFKTAQIKITPSKNYDVKLSERTIPYYYQTYKSLVNNWNPVSNKNRKPTNQLGYHLGNLKDIPCIQKPLEYNHLDKNFFRIEGHQGKNFVTALKGIQTLRKRYNLPFDVKAISIGYPVNNISLDEDTCETKEYITLLQSWEREFSCTAEKAIKFFQKYQYVTPGINDTVADIYTTVHKVAQAENDKEEIEKLENEKLEDAQADVSKEEVRKEEAQKEEVKEVSQREVLGQNLSINKKTQAGTETLAYAIDKVVSNINIENLTADFAVSQVVRTIEKDQPNTNVDGDEFKLYVEIPLRMITNLQIVKYRFIKNLQDVYVTERWTAFHKAFSGLCDEVQKVIYTLSETTENGTFGTKVHDKMYEYYIHQIANLCCLKDRFNWLKVQLDGIRKNLYKELILSNLLAQHPGMEHMAGVPKGGTFLMVYIGEKKVTMEDSGAIVETFDRKVLFDFALPYMCKAACAPDTIVYSDIVDPVTLAIARKKFCLPSDAGQENFIIEPENGVVTSPDGNAFIITTATGYAFDPSNVPDALLGEGIRFLVDGKIPTIPIEAIVYKLPEDVIATYEFITWTDDGLVINLNVTHELEDLLYLSHTWKRENGFEMAVGKSPTNILIITDEITFQESITLVINVIGNQVPCKLEIPIAIDEEREIIEVDVEIESEICFNTQETSPTLRTITVTPTDGILTSPQEPVDGQSFIESANGVYSLNPMFVPDALAGEPITFLVNNTLAENVETRVYKLPGTVTTNATLISWDDTGLFVNITATHAFADKSYLEYEWLNENDEVIGTTLHMPNFRIDAEGSNVDRTFKLRMRVIGSENDLCTASDFSVTINEDRPEITVSIPPAICWQENTAQEAIQIIVSDDSLELTCPQQDAFGVNFLEGEPGNYRLNVEAVPDELIGVSIFFEIDETEVASTKVYKVPSSVAANYDNVTWQNNTLIIDIRASHNLEGIDSAEDYLSYIWRNQDEEIVLMSKERINFEINTEEGSISEEYTLQVKVREELIQNACETETILVTIEENRPVIEVTIAPEICYIESANDEISTTPIIVTPSSYSLSSPDGSIFIEGTLGNYSLNPAAVSEELLGEEIRFVVDGQVRATTIVYKLPQLVQTPTEVQNEQWVNDGLAIDLVSTIVSRDYYKYEWFMRKNNVDTLLDKIAEPNRYLIPDTGEGVNVEVFLRLSADTNNILCIQETIKKEIIRHRPISVSKNKFCLPDTPVIFRGISTETGDLQCTNASLPTNVITPNNNKYQFNPNNVPEALWGTTLRFSVGGITQNGVAINVYKTPTKESIVQDVPASKWVSNGYEFAFTHELIYKNYFTYKLTLKSDGSQLNQVGAHRYLIPTTDNGINDSVIVNISTQGVACSEANSIRVVVQRPTDAVGRLDCSTPYLDRMKILKVPTLLNTLKNVYSEQNFGSAITSDILDPVNAVINGIINARNTNSIAELAVKEINRLRAELAGKYYKNPNIDPKHYQSFLELDEAMELIVLELIRCVDKNADSNLFQEVNAFFNESSTINSEYSVTPRNIIDKSYVTNYTPIVSGIKTKADTIFDSTKKQ